MYLQQWAQGALAWWRAPRNNKLQSPCGHLHVYNCMYRRPREPSHLMTKDLGSWSMDNIPWRLCIDPLHPWRLGTCPRLTIFGPNLCCEPTLHVPTVEPQKLMNIIKKCNKVWVDQIMQGHKAPGRGSQIFLLITEFIGSEFSLILLGHLLISEFAQGPSQGPCPGQIYSAAAQKQITYYDYIHWIKIAIIIST